MMEKKRVPAKKVRILDLTNGKYFPGSKEEMKASYVITPFGEKVSRINMVATVTDKFVSEDGNYSTITIDDGTGAIRVKTFKEDVSLLSKVEPSNLVLVVGKVKDYNNELYINGEIVKKLENPNYENLRKLEILEQLTQKKKLVEEIRKLSNEMSEEELKNYSKEAGVDEETLRVILESKSAEIDYRPKILKVIEGLDDGSGVDVSKIFEMSKLPENLIESVLDDLLNSGMLFEPHPGKLRKV